MGPLSQRHSVRLKGYDYAGVGAYFVTVCTAHYRQVFGEVIGTTVRLFPLGEIVRDEWLKTGPMRHVEIDVFVVMPNHFHAIVNVRESSNPLRNMNGQGRSLLPNGGDRRHSGVLGSLVAGFKGAVSSRARRELTLGFPIWQRGYHEHIVRNDADLARIGDYIATNPAKWSDDRYHV